MMKITDDRILDGLDYLCCQKEICIGAYDLINRQKAEIESLNIELQSMRSAANSYKMHYKTAKSEAIKEFAEELEYFVLNEDVEIVKPKCKYYGSYINGANQFRHQIKNGINNLVKEMTEVNENE